jgi:hypothetical protein
MPQVHATRIVSLYGDLALESWDGHGRSHLVYLAGEPENGFSLTELKRSEQLDRILVAHGIPTSSGLQDARSPAQRSINYFQDLFLQAHGHIASQWRRRKRALDSN